MIGATTNCSVKRFTTRFARDTEAQRIPCHRENVAGIPAAGVPATIIPATPLGVIQRERGGDSSIWTSPPPGCFSFFSSRCLGASSEAGGESSFEWLFERHCT